MKAILLAAGRGSRMKGLTDVKPKCLNEILNRPLFDWQIDALRTAGIQDIVVGRGYKKELLEGDFQTVDNDRWDQTNMVSTLDCARKYLREDTCIVSYADIVYHPDHIKALMAAEGDIVITFDKLWRPLWELRFSDPLADAETFSVNDDGVVQEIGQRAETLDQIQGQYMGLLKFTPKGWAKVEELLDGLGEEVVDKLDMTSLLQRIIESKISVQTTAIQGRWCEVDSEEDLNAYAQHLETTSWSHDWRW